MQSKVIKGLGMTVLQAPTHIYVDSPKSRKVHRGKPERLLTQRVIQFLEQLQVC